MATFAHVPPRPRGGTRKYLFVTLCSHLSSQIHKNDIIWFRIMPTTYWYGLILSNDFTKAQSMAILSRNEQYHAPTKSIPSRRLTTDLYKVIIHATLLVICIIRHTMHTVDYIYAHILYITYFPSMPWPLRHYNWIFSSTSTRDEVSIDNGWRVRKFVVACERPWWLVRKRRVGTFKDWYDWNCQFSWASGIFKCHQS